MTPQLRVENIWFDDDVLELKFEACDGRSLFSCDTYVARSWPQDTVVALNIFREHIHGGIFDLKAGEFGVEYANGAALARLHFLAPGSLYISICLQSDFSEYKNSQVASEAKIYLRSEPVLLDQFIEQLRELGLGSRKDASLACA
jgi:hypothetical protein